MKRTYQQGYQQGTKPPNQSIWGAPQLFWLGPQFNLLPTYPNTTYPHTPFRGVWGRCWEGQGIVRLGMSEKDSTFPKLGRSPIALGSLRTRESENHTETREKSGHAMDAINASFHAPRVDDVMDRHQWTPPG